MRPVNLIPQEQRRDRAGSRTGPLAYIVIAALVLALGGVALLVTSSNKISERESELAAVETQKAAVALKVDRLSPYLKFSEVEQQRTATITELADSRFDWPRVIRQLSLILPKYVVLTELVGVAGNGASEGGEEAGGGNNLTAAIKGPSLSMIGCAANQKRVAALIVALKQIDGVTRVGLSKSVRKTPTGGTSEESEGCLPRDAAFTIAVAFDAAPASPDSGSGVVPVVEETPAPTESESSESESGSTESESGETSTSTSTTVSPPAN